MAKKILSTTLILLLTLSLSAFALAQGNQRIIATQNQLKTNYQNRYQLSTGEYIGVEITKEKAKVQIRLRVSYELGIKNCSCENMQVVEIEKELNQKRIAYQVNEEHEGRLLWIFVKRVKVQTNLDIETGELISMKTPWYIWMMSFKGE